MSRLFRTAEDRLPIDPVARAIFATTHAIVPLLPRDASIVRRLYRIAAGLPAELAPPAAPAEQPASRSSIPRSAVAAASRVLRGGSS